MKLNELTIAGARKRLDKGEITALELAKICLKHIKQVDRRLNACLAIDERGALAAAQAADERLAAGERTPLLGIPFLAKDNIMTAGIVTTAASKILENYTAPYDATVIAKLKEAGAVLLGKTNLDEFAHGASTEYSAFGPTKNPWDVTRVPGGSSGGSAAAVAADMCLFALGTDTGGSVRHPASFCGVVGLKPTYGRCSRFGLIAMTSSTDVPGVLAKTVEDAEIVLGIMAGKDERDATTVKQSFKTVKDFSWKGKKIGLPKEYFSNDLNPAVRRAVTQVIDLIKKAGGKTVAVSLPATSFAVPAYYIITPSEISSNLARFDSLRYGRTPKKTKDLLDYYVTAREEGFGPEVKRRIILGTFALSAGYFDAYYRRAQSARQRIIEDFEKAFKKCDLLLTPTTPSPAFKLGAKKNPLSMYLEDIFSAPASLAGLPAISLPAAKKPLPVGVQLIGAQFDESALLAAAADLERQLRLDDIKPNLS